MQQKKTFHRGWRMPFVCMIMVAATSLFSTGMSTNLNAIKTIYHLSGTLSSTIVTIRSVSAFLVMLAADRYFEKFGVRCGTAAAMLIGVLGFVLFAVGNGNIFIYYLAAALGGITYSYGLMLPSSILLNKWFNQHRGLAFSIASAGTGLCSVIGAPVIQTLIERYDLKTAFLAQAAFLLAVSLMLLLVVVNDPAEVSAEPVGGAGYMPEKKKSAGAGKRTEALPKHWVALLVLVTTMIGASTSPASAHLTLNFTTNGFDAMTVAKAVSVYGVTLILAKLLCGWVNDRLGAVKTIYIYGTVLAVGKTLCWLTMYRSGIPFLFVTMIFYGAGVPVETLGYPNWCADLTIPQNYTKVLSRLQTGYQLGALLASSVPGIIYDATGYYSWYYLGCAVTEILALGIVLAAYRRFVPGKKKKQADGSKKL